MLICHKDNPFPLPFKKGVSFFRITLIFHLLTKAQSSDRQTQMTNPLKNDENTYVAIAYASPSLHVFY